MKKLYRCDFCNYTGTEEEVLKHEQSCIYKTRSCDRCRYAMVVYDDTYDAAYFICVKGVNINKEYGVKRDCDMFKNRAGRLNTRFKRQLKANKYIREMLEEWENSI